MGGGGGIENADGETRLGMSAVFQARKLEEKKMNSQEKPVRKKMSVIKE